MRLIKQMLACIVFIGAALYPTFSLATAIKSIPILCYHNFNPTVPGIMNITPQKFEEQLAWLKEHGYVVIPLKQAVEYLQGTRSNLPDKAVVITADDGWESVYTYMLPIVKKYNVPVTLFIYPSVISKRQHVLTWEQLQTLEKTGLFDVQGHTYWNPNFKDEKRHLSATSYAALVNMQLVKSKRILEAKMGHSVSLLAWPFGIYDPQLEAAAKQAGYTMSFSVDDEAAAKHFRIMAEPRFVMRGELSMKMFGRLMEQSAGTKF